MLRIKRYAPSHPVFPDGYFTIVRDGIEYDTAYETGPEALEAAHYSHAWPGGYPVAWLDEDNATMCSDCALAAQKEYGVDYTPFVLEEPSEDGVMCERCNEWIDPPYTEDAQESPEG